MFLYIMLFKFSHL